MLSHGRTLMEAITVLNDILERKPEPEKSEEELREERARANEQAMAQLNAMMAGVSFG